MEPLHTTLIDDGFIKEITCLSAESITLKQVDHDLSLGGKKGNNISWQMVELWIWILSLAGDECPYERLHPCHFTLFALVVTTSPLRLGTG